MGARAAASCSSLDSRAEDALGIGGSTKAVEETLPRHRWIGPGPRPHLRRCKLRPPGATQGRRRGAQRGDAAPGRRYERLPVMAVARLQDDVQYPVAGMAANPAFGEIARREHLRQHGERRGQASGWDGPRAPHHAGPTRPPGLAPRSPNQRRRGVIKNTAATTMPPGDLAAARSNSATRSTWPSARTNSAHSPESPSASGCTARASTGAHWARAAASSSSTAAAASGWSASAAAAPATAEGPANVSNSGACHRRARRQAQRDSGEQTQRSP